MGYRDESIIRLFGAQPACCKLWKDNKETLISTKWRVRTHNLKFSFELYIHAMVHMYAHIHTCIHVHIHQHTNVQLYVYKNIFKFLLENWTIDLRERRKESTRHGGSHRNLLNWTGKTGGIPQVWGQCGLESKTVYEKRLFCFCCFFFWDRSLSV